MPDDNKPVIPAGMVMLDQATHDKMKRAMELVEDKWNDPTIGTSLRKAAKEKFGVPIPDDNIDPIVAPLREQVTTLQTELAAERAAREADIKAREDAQQAANLEVALSNARSKYNLTEEGFTKMVERMKATGNYGDPEAAAAFVAMQNPPPKPRAATPSWSPGEFQLMSADSAAEDIKLLMDDPQRYQDTMLQRFAEDPDAFVRDAGLAA